MTATEQVLIEKIKQLPPQRMAEVEDFVDFLRAREDEQRLTHAATHASDASFAQVWDRDEGALDERSVAAAGIAPMPLEEIDADVEAARAERERPTLKQLLLSDVGRVEHLTPPRRG